MTKKFLCVCLGILVLAVALYLGTKHGKASTVEHSRSICVVTSTADDGPGTLRWCLETASNGDTITFDPGVFPPSSPASILLASPLPWVIQGSLTIDASSAGVILDGTIASPGTVGLTVDSDSNTVKGLQVLHFPGNGIVLTNSADYNTVEANLISDNGGRAGLEISGSDNIVQGNLIGTDPSGSGAMGNDNQGIYIGDASNNRIGPGNIVAYDGGFGIEVEGISATGNTITQNSISLNVMDGIQLSNGGNAELPPPTITVGTDTSASGTACPNCTIEIFSDVEDEGSIYEGSTSSDGTGAFAFVKPEGLTGPNITATATDSAGNTSGFSAAVTVAIESSSWGAIKALFTD